MRIGVDVGGTFTDLVVLDGRNIITVKVPSTPIDQSVGVINSLRGAELDPAAVEAVAHGTTVATNALLERKGARTALVTTEGFRDVIEIGRQDRPSLYDLTEDRASSLVPRDLRFTVRERMGPAGPILPIDEDSIQQVIDALRVADVEAIAVCLLFSFLHPSHELLLGDRLRDAFPETRVSLSSEVLPEFREYERFSTTVADAYLGPRLARYFSSLADSVTRSGFPLPQVMQSSGGVIDMEQAADRASACVLSGPAGGVVGAAFVAELSGYRDVLTLDMGGTSTDVAPVMDGNVQLTTDAKVAGLPIKLPMVDVHTVSAGGGSIAWVDDGGALRVGPHSAGADPGPVAYGKGGTEITVTDANLLLGYLADGSVLGGEVRLDAVATEAAMQRLADELGLQVPQAALGVIRVANAEMLRALRVISVQRGLDPREFCLVAFGGAGPMHACALAEELDIETVLVPKHSGVLSALGLTISDLRRDYVRPMLSSMNALSQESLVDTLGEMSSTAEKDLPGSRHQSLADLRYRGQSFELTVQLESLETLEKSFHELHEQLYGYRMSDQPVELVNLRLVATVDGLPANLEESRRQTDRKPGMRRANFGGEWIEVEVLARDAMGVGSAVEGPAIVELSQATCVVGRGWRGEVDHAGTLILTRT